MPKRKKDKSVPVLLLENVTRVGNKGEVKKLKMGFALFLMRKKQAMIINPKNMTNIEIVRHLIDKKLEEKAKSVEEVENKIKSLVMEAKLKVGEHGEVYNSITKEKIKKFLEGNGIKIEKENILLKEPIKELGEHIVELNIGLGKKVPLKIKVEAEKSK